ncbi:MAG: hypothetical protein ACRDJH_02455 [Thermomicrobiales bacterium]
MSKKQKPQRQRRAPEHPTDKYARSHKAPPASEVETPEQMSDLNGKDLIDEASEDSFPASDPPGYTRGSSNHTTARKR